MKTEPTKEEVARHEAAHLVVAWAVEYPMKRIDITPTARKTDDNDPNYERLGYNDRDDCDGNPPFENLLIDLAGPVADCWGSDNPKILEDAKDLIDSYAEFYDKEKALPAGNHDWDHAMECLAYLGCDIAIQAEREKWLNLFLDEVRAILKLCATQWQEVTEHLVIHGRIGFYGPHNPRPSYVPPLPAVFKNRPQPDEGEEAQNFFLRWGEDNDKPPKAIQECVARFREAVGHGALTA